MAVSMCPCIPHRYVIVFMSFLGMLVSVGYRTVFAMVLTHISSSGNSTNSHSSESMFDNCTTQGTDFSVDWSGSTLFLFHTAFFIGQFITTVPGGALLSSFSAKRCFGASIFMTSVLFLLLPISAQQSKYIVYVIRLLQGSIEAMSVPAMNAVISTWAPSTERARLINIAYAGVYLSAAVAMFTTGYTTCYVSWDSIFYIYGSVGAVWSILWLLIVFPSPDIYPSLNDEERTLLCHEQHAHRNNTAAKTKFKDLPWRSFFTSLPVIAVLIASLTRNFVFTMLITEVQQYYKDVYNMKSFMIGILSACPHVLMVVFMLTGSCFFDYLYKTEKASLTVVRKLAQCSGYGVQGICLLVLVFIDKQWHAFIWFCVGTAFSGFAISGYQTNPLDLAPRFAGPLTGIVRTGMIGAIISTILASQLPGKSHSLKDWQHMFLIAAILHLVGVVFYLVFASGRIQSWAVVPIEETVEPTSETDTQTGRNKAQTESNKAQKITEDSSVKLYAPTDYENLMSNETKYGSIY